MRELSMTRDRGHSVRVLRMETTAKERECAVGRRAPMRTVSHRLSHQPAPCHLRRSRMSRDAVTAMTHSTPSASAWAIRREHAIRQQTAIGSRLMIRRSASTRRPLRHQQLQHQQLHSHRHNHSTHSRSMMQQQDDDQSNLPLLLASLGSMEASAALLPPPVEFTEEYVKQQQQQHSR